MDRKILGEKLKYLRTKDNLSMDQLANNFNDEYGSSISKSMISSWENGRYLISPKNLNIYNNYFKVPPFYFSVDYIKSEDFESLRVGDYEKYKDRIIDNDFGEFDDYLETYFDEKNIDEDSKNIIKDDIDFLMTRLNLNGYRKVLSYVKDIAKINKYLEYDHYRDN